MNKVLMKPLRKVLSQCQCSFLKFKLNKFNFCSKVKIDPKASGVEDAILYKQHNRHTTEVILNQPKKLNSLDYKMVKGLLKRVQEWIPDNIESSSDEDKEENLPKMVLFSGNGKAFCAGGDVATLVKQKNEKDGMKLNKNFFRYEYLLDYSITKMKPVQIAFWHGAVMGGGCGISVNAPIRIATENTIFAMPETAIGLFPDVGATWFLPRIFNNNLPMGMYIGLSGDRIRGQDLAKCGYATHYVNLEKFAKLKEELIAKANSSINLETITDICNSYSDFVYSPKNFSYEKIEMVNKVFKLDSLKEVVLRLKSLEESGTDKEKEWAKKTLGNFAKFSPISMVVTFEQIRRGVDIKSIEEAFNIESQLVNACMENNDFFEGVRALLIDKDNKPNWEYKSIDEVNVEEVISKYFNRKEDHSEPSEDEA